MLNKKILSYALALICLCACVPDRGTYDYIKLNEVAISGIDNEEPYDVNRFSEFELPVDLEFSNGKDEKNFEYLWYMYIIGNDKIDTISREKNLKYKFNELPGKYNVVYKVIDKKHDVYYHKNFEIRVINTIDEGFLILGEIDDSVHLSMVNMAGILSTDMYYSMKGKYIAQKPERIFHFIPGNKGAYTGREYITVTHDGGKASLFDPINFVHVASEKDMFVLPPTTYNIMGYNAGARLDILINDKKIHTRAYYVPYDAVVRDDALGYEASTISLSRGLFNCYFDNKNRRFMTLNSSKTEVMTMSLTRKSAAFPIGDVKKDLIAAYCASSGFTSALVKDDTGKLSVLDYVLRTEVDVTKMQFSKETPVAAESPLYRAKDIVFPLAENINYMLYYVENESIIRLYDIIGNRDQISGVVTRDYDIYDFKTIGANLHIDKIFAAENQLAIAYTDSAATGERKCGIVIFDVVLSDEGVALVEKYHHKGITERIVDVAYKFSTI